mmetsp:Transcript_32899/g.37679  ORF Transcript_32899/g.37679 Transcript_32899/m.37679 type:complete len:83 (+) Transcript_32899:183-431(+)
MRNSEHDEAKDNMFVKDATFDLEEIYKRPGKIENRDIITNADEKITLKPNLQEIYDYVIVDYNSWILLKSWYGCDFQVQLKS